jgi:citronellol/citronellal dehydrogenase
MSLEGKTIFITGASRGIGLAIGLRAALDGANVAIAAKTAVADPKLPGTVYTAAKEIEAAGGKALPLVCDIRDEEQIKDAIQKCIDKFGALDILVNNASAISLTNTLDTPVKKYDLMHSINGRGTWLVSKYAIPHLIKSNKNPHILNISPPPTLEERWFKDHVAYTIAKFNMSLCVLGMAGELRDHGIGVNALWPLTLIDTAAVRNLLGGESVASTGRTPEIMADAAYKILTKDSKTFSGNFLVDELFLREEGQIEFDHYSMTPGNKELGMDFYITDEMLQKVESLRQKADALKSKL